MRAAFLAALLLAGCPEQGAPADGAPPDQTTADGGCALEAGPEPPVPTPEIYTPRWAFEPWISKDISTTADTYAFVDGFSQRDIPVGVVVLDSPWETNYNTFVPNPKRYPAFDKLVSDLHGRGIRVVLWITQMVNATSFDLEAGGDSYPTASPNFAEGKRCGFFVNSGATYLWWKGAGAGVDLFNPVALSWWHRQQDGVLALGIDGWKLDFGESYLPWAPMATAAGKVSHQSYSEEYYRDFWAYGVLKRGQEFTTMVRGWDASYQFKGRFHARPEHAPVVWAGDNRRDWVGLADALDHIFRSAQAGYVVVGSDIGGYLDHDDKDLSKTIPFDHQVFARWTAVGALSPFMQLHGRANLTPWTVQPRTDEIVALYRYWSWLHHELVPFFFSLAQEAYAGGAGVLRPVGQPDEWPGDYRYLLGDAFLVAPLLDGTGTRDVELPSGARWYDWWRPADPALDGGQTLAAYDASDISRVPLFVREGAIVPVTVSGDVTGLGSAKSAGHLTVLVYPSASKTSFRLHETDGKVTTIDTQRLGTGGPMQINLSRASSPTILRLRAESAPLSVTVNKASLPARATFSELEAATTGHYTDAASQLVWVKLGASPGAAVQVELAFQ